ncbi:MAG: hypothetical protein HFACDABA_01715 [Anaerolineales bacterium]|nr:hypothetical protein [Anaerolineales bacterium]
MSDWQTDFEHEIARAESARAKKNEGQVRVCARRAAGMVVREYFTRIGIPVRTPSAYELLKLLAEQPHLPLDAQQAASLLTLRVNEAFRLPVDADLVAEARKLREALLG